jgi:hypothetical protein
MNSKKKIFLLIKKFLNKKKSIKIEIKFNNYLQLMGKDLKFYKV